MSNSPYQRLRAGLSALYGSSIYGALLLVVFGGLVIPAIIGSYLLVGVHERQSARTSLNEALQRNADILALGMQESLWNMNAESAHSLVESVMRDRAVLLVKVVGQGDTEFISLQAPQRPVGNLYRAERDILVRGERIGHVVVEMDDARSQQELREKQVSYIFVLGAQLAVSMALIVLFLNRRLLKPLRRLMRFSDRLSHGDFDTRLVSGSNDELGRLAAQLEQMRAAIRQLFEDVGQREERFRTIVTQVPGAVFRYRPDGPIDFVSDAIEEIAGYSARQFMRGTTHAWADLICPEDRREHRRAVKQAVRDVQPYALEYRIVDAFGTERWVAENGQPQAGEHGVTWVDGIIADISQRKHHEMRIEALLTEQSAILDNVMFGVMFVRHRRIISVNRRCEDLFGYGPGDMMGKSTAIVFTNPYDFEEAGERQYPALATGGDFSEERQYKRRDGSLFWALVSGCALDPQRPNEGSIWVYADITARKEAEEKLRLSATVLEHIADGVMVVDADGIIVTINPAFTQITGYSEAEALGRHASLTRSARHDAAFYQALWDELAASGFWRGEIWNQRKNGEVYLEWLTISAVRDTRAGSTHYVGVFSDITLIKESQEKLDHMAHHDPLTALPNRLLFHDRLQHALLRAGRDQEQLAILFIDLDRFKNVNDTLGHHVGDELLQKVAGQLTARLREGDTLARLGGDEFIVLLERIDGEYGATQVAEKLVTMFEQPFTVAGHELFVTCSVGISLYPDDALDLNMLIRNADVAMYQAKARGRNGYRFYAPSMTGEGVERLRLETFLRRSIEKNEIFLTYQPQVEIDTGRLVGVEALVRWNHPELGLVPPARFIPLAEDSGFINQLGKWVLDEACRQMMRWQAQGLRVPKMAVNLSVKQFERGSIAGMVADILKETGLEPQRLQLEVTESVIMNTGDALGFINDLHAIGVGLAIDDFGTGYSSLAYLKQLPVQTLKIDRSFIKDISTDVNDEAIAIAIIQLGKSMQLSVIAEGVETEEQAAFLLRHGCKLAQGYFYSRPVLAQDMLERWIDD
ncbi:MULTISPECIES: EAL domain-containing protein [unclassified Janthinobacterium]|uniref:EAL domain-containing protein n=1 Tax=unclassified Janthinobacterium TaxID=2610881 RepID=UPI00088E9A60|nr:MULTISPECIES: EAL domain-containing protein [unclassified Janthinobacterium]SDA39879.1 PAS domain S-box-containing protein/diguanylate cyclase (GGDEF) domain-containing protein [Janthinobacterium sp. 551a]SFA82153.1 PAS domain S-box-containing protein/diguanylate cyclase (GGDEF) domain-containing protein [Janthinobacterium sp. 344]